MPAKVRKINKPDASKRVAQRRIALVVAGDPTTGGGGAERLNRGLVTAFQASGYAVDTVLAPHREGSVDEILDNYRRTSSIDLSGYDLAISGKVPTYAVSHPAHTTYLVHTVRVFDDMFEQRFPDKYAELFVHRQQVHHADFEALSQGQLLVTIGHEVTDRLWRYRGLSSLVAHPPMEFVDFEDGDPGDYFFIASRLHPWKRIDLSIDALVSSDLPVRLLIAGEGEAEEELKRRAQGDKRVEFLGRVSDSELKELYKGCLAVPFTPLREDYGYATLEAFAAGKPVVTVTDSGEPCRFVEHGLNGYVVRPTADAVREAFRRIADLPDRGRAMGRAGKAVVERLDWPKTVDLLTGSGNTPRISRQEVVANHRTTNILVTDMQPITPAIGGGRLRLLGLYHGMGEHNRCTYVGSYDWPGEARRDHQLTPGLREVIVPLSDEHHQAAARKATELKGQNVIDLLFSRMAHLSPDFVNEVKKGLAGSDVVIFSHPWVYPLMREQMRPFQTIIYDSHNVESFLRGQLLDMENPDVRAVVEAVAEDEALACQEADWIFCCSLEDMKRFNRLYGTPFEKMRVVPNGVMAYAPGLQDAQSEPLKKRSRTRRLRGIFIGSEYGPNVDAAVFINEELAPAMPEVDFVIAGGVGQCVNSPASNVEVTGRIEDDQKIALLKGCDFAINPMLSGSGTNIKMFDFMAAGLPVVTTEIGARGISDPLGEFMIICEADVSDFREAVRSLEKPERRDLMGAAARRVVERNFAWENISEQVGMFCQSRKRMGRSDRPLYSVVIPSYERHDQLRKVLEALSRQVERDFEVIVVDQSDTPAPFRDEAFGFPLTYFHSTVKGAVPARNLGAFLAQGAIIAFTDDDCVPEKDWLLNAREYFTDPEVVGLEGLITSDRLDDPDWRPVTNVGFEGIGFMTANLFVRSGVFQEVGGFDTVFDNPHFREDTDLAWRLLDIGKVPYGKDVAVFHPAQPRSLDRESLESRSKFFVKDAMLFQRHPDRYRELFDREYQWGHNPHFKPNLLRGFQALGIAEEQLPSWLKQALEQSA